MKTTNTDQLAAPVDRVLALLCAERFLVPAHEARDDVASVAFETLRDDDEEQVVAVHIRQYRRGKTGRLDRNATDPTTMTYRLVKPFGPVHWRYSGPDTRIRIQGVTRVTAYRGGTGVVEEADIDVRLPLIGRPIARTIARGIDRTFEANKTLVRRLLIA